jgi:hypothetical protein
MKKQWLEIKLEVPADSVDFKDCGDGCGFVSGLQMAKFKGFPILEFEDAIAATAEMNRQLGESQPVLVGRRPIPQHIIDSEREAFLNDPINRARGRA